VTRTLPPDLVHTAGDEKAAPDAEEDAKDSASLKGNDRLSGPSGVVEPVSPDTKN